MIRKRFGAFALLSVGCVLTGSFIAGCGNSQSSSSSNTKRLNALERELAQVKSSVQRMEESVSANAAGSKRRHLVPMLVDPNEQVRLAAARLVAEFADPDLQAPVLEMAGKARGKSAGPALVLALSPYAADDTARKRLAEWLDAGDPEVLLARISVLRGCRVQAMAGVLLDLEQSLPLMNPKKPDRDMVNVRNEIVAVLADIGNPLAVPRLLDRIRLQSLSGQACAEALGRFKDVQAVPDGAAEILKAMRENPPETTTSSEASAVLNCIRVAHRVPGGENLTHELVLLLDSTVRGVNTAAGNALVEQPHAKRGEHLLSIIMGPHSQKGVPVNPDKQKRWEYPLALLVRSNDKACNEALGKTLAHSDKTVASRALRVLKSRAYPALAPHIRDYFLACAKDPAFPARDDSATDLLYAVQAIYAIGKLNSFQFVEPVFDLINHPGMNSGSSKHVKDTKKRNVAHIWRTSLSIFRAQFVPADVPRIAHIHNAMKLTDGKAAVRALIEEMRLPVVWSKDKKTVTVKADDFKRMQDSHAQFKKTGHQPDEF